MSELPPESPPGGSPAPKKEDRPVPPATPPAPKQGTGASAAGQPTPSAPRKRRRRRGKKREGAAAEPAPPKKKKPGSQHHALRAVRALADMTQALLRAEGVDFLAMPRYMDIQVRVPLDPARDSRNAAAATVDRILERVHEVREHEMALKPGAVYCYFEGSSEASTSRPTEPRQVFDGYTSTGRPIFTDFVTMAIERKDPALDQLLEGQDVILTHVTMGRVLRTAQLAEFGQSSPVFRILGQVDAGLFKVLNMDQKAAFSIQLLLGTTLEGKPRLRLHPVGKADIMDLADPSVALILSRFQRRLDAESLRLAGKQAQGEVDEEEFVLPLLQELAKQLSGRARREGRRTQHANQRSEEGLRPTTRAYSDAGEASDENLLWDDSQNTAVVLGPRGRVHIFSPDARHVTSVVMQGSAVFRRRQQHRWRPAEPEERGEFRIQLRQRMQRGDTPLQEEGPVDRTPPPREAPVPPPPPPEGTAAAPAPQTDSEQPQAAGTPAPEARSPAAPAAPEPTPAEPAAADPAPPDPAPPEPPAGEPSPSTPPATAAETAAQPAADPEQEVTIPQADRSATDDSAGGGELEQAGGHDQVDRGA